jgi:hypothetical protein
MFCGKSKWDVGCGLSPYPGISFKGIGNWELGIWPTGLGYYYYLIGVFNHRGHREGAEYHRELCGPLFLLCALCV